MQSDAYKSSKPLFTTDHDRSNPDGNFAAAYDRNGHEALFHQRLLIGRLVPGEPFPPHQVPYPNPLLLLSLYGIRADLR
jgi:hypothetical protein